MVKEAARKGFCAKQQRLESSIDLIRANASAMMATG
jgi:hypothetical protein